MPPHESAFTGDWITGGMAVLNETDGRAELNESFRVWLSVQESEKPNATEFWTTLFATEPGWKDPISAALSKSQTFQRLDLRSARPGTAQWFSFELARAGGVCFVQLNSILPPLTELEEGASEEFLQSASSRQQMWVRLLRAEGQLNNLVRRWPGVIFSQRVDLSFHFVSPKIEELTGVPVEEWKRMPQRFWQVVHEGDSGELQQQLRQALHNPDGVTSVYRIRHVKTGRVSYVMEHREAVRTQRGLLLGYEGVWLDVTRQTIAEKRLSTAAWKETLSVLTMGLAHDFSNIMAGIHSLSETFQSQVNTDHPFHEGLALIKRNSLQASQLIHRILHLHHGKIGERNYQNLNDLVADILELVRKIVPRHIRFETELGTESLPVFVDAVEFRQVLINLALNAVDAMPQGGRLRFVVSRQEGETPPLMHLEGTLPKPPRLCVATEDSGCGIPFQLLQSIFDPFFTTKSLDKGSGLGLYNARLFAEKHHGAISVDSTEGKGTTIHVWLPEADFTEGERELNPPPSERRTVLVMGSTGSGLENMAEYLRRNNFSVVTASSANTALELLDRRDYTLSAVLLLPGSADRSFSRIAAAARKVGGSVKIVVQAAGCNQDELDGELLGRADLVLSPDIPRSEIVSRMNSLWPAL